MNRKNWLFAVVLAAGCLLPSAAMAESTDLTLFVDNQEVVSYEDTGTPYISDSGRTMVPLRVVNDYLKYTTDWTSDGKIHITGKDGAVDITVQAGSTAYTANGETGQFETAPVIRENGRTYLPVRDFGQLYGSVYWSSVDRMVWVNDRPGISYAFSGHDMVRCEGNNYQIVTVPTYEGDIQIDMSDVPEFVTAQKEYDGKQYIVVLYDINILRHGELFRDDGDHMTHLGSINITSDFAVDGNTVYDTLGTNNGHAYYCEFPNRLYAWPIGEGGRSAQYTLDFAVNACKLDMENGNLVATEPDGTRHVLDLSTLTPDEE